MERMKKALFYEKCSFQFDKKIVYDIHLSFFYKISGKVESEDKQTQYIKRECVLFLIPNSADAKGQLSSE